MAETYDPKTIETKWQKRWQEEELFAAGEQSAKKKMYVLDMFPYPSGEGLHVGHVKIYTATDVVARYLRMKGFNVLHPTGWDAFGLPTENSAIKLKVHPSELTKKNVERFKKQMQMMGFSYDWNREINTTDPAYYKWTQWIFLQLHKMGLAYQDTVAVNWCPDCRTGLANEEVVEGHCERCGAAVEQKPMRQWMLRITKYAERLLRGLDGLDWPDFIVESQRNWIGRSEGVEIDFKVVGHDKTIKVFTTRPDTIFGATFMVLSPEHPMVAKLQKSKEVEEYAAKAREKTDRQRTAVGEDVTGVQLEGVMVVNPVNGGELPVWVADYVLMGYGTGAIMAVPAHDARDFDLAKKYELPVTQVVQPVLAEGVCDLPFGGEGVLVNSGDYSGVKSAEAAKMITESLQLKGAARRKVNYKLRDWVFSRQHYWGEPIPVVHCDSCGAVPVPDEDLPVVLPEVESYQPTGTGESPLANIEDWIKVKCPTCAREGRRETDTMPSWAGSSWYWLRYVDSQNGEELAEQDKLAKWLPVDVYVGGAEHAVLHLLYARFWSYVLSDIGVVPYEEPFKRFRSVGLLLGEDGQKMSKSRGNVVNPDEVVERVGADALRVYVMFMGPFGGAMPWSEAGLNGAARFLQRVWDGLTRLTQHVEEEREEEQEFKLIVQQMIKRVSEGIEQFRFNTVVAAMMELLNELEKRSAVTRSTLETYILLLAPYAPHLAEELWFKLGHGRSLICQDWPTLDQALLARAGLKVPVQVNGKVRGEIEVPAGSSKTQVEVQARGLPNVKRYLSQGKVVRVVYVEGRMINFVVGIGNERSGAPSSS